MQPFSPRRRRRRRSRSARRWLALALVLAVVLIVGWLRGVRTAPATQAAPAVAPPLARIGEAMERLGVKVAVPSPSTAPTALSQAPPSPLGQILQQGHEAAFLPAEIDELSHRFFVYGNALPARFAVDWYRIKFSSTDRDGSPLEIVAQIFLPRAAGQEMPVYAFGPGTTGLRDECAPSHEQPTERNWGDFEAHLLSFAAQGYVAVMPDYAASRGPEGVQYYYISEMHARTMLDAARAALRFTASPPAGSGGARAANAIFFAGYSQGGHASFAARDAAARYAPELKVMGAMGYGPRGAVATMLEEAPFLAPYLFFSYASYYGEDKVPLRELLVPTITRSLKADVTSKCIDEVPAYYGDFTPWIFQPALDDAIDRRQLDQKFPALKQLLDSNDAGRSQSKIPVLILQGLSDTLVRPETQRAFVQTLCTAGGGAPITFNTYEGIPHDLTRQVSYRDTLAWMAGTMEGRPPRSDCAGR